MHLNAVATVAFLLNLLHCFQKHENHCFFCLPVMAEIITLEAKLCLVSQFDKGSTTTINVPLLL